MATAMGGSIDGRVGEHSPLRLYVSNLVKALPEVGVHYIAGRGLHQTFPADPHYTLGPAKETGPASSSSHRSNSQSGGDLWTAQPLSSPECPRQCVTGTEVQ
ncbi:hypothetical protein ATANTOWER_010400 [Ataeniobius toweri]|uniref:Uncharacterized protein n=1 Tax=Ataeniobius toweri TaxID=208326 RepID=A0ABU7C0W0_9TELE|nr:hypothetical protein [Ataeniobius toweri]